jgi:hypothetical protein
MILVYPSITPERPVIHVAVRSGGHVCLWPMVVDTGADSTCFPAAYAGVIGHDNRNNAVHTDSFEGIGGKVTGNRHKLQVGLVNPLTKRAGGKVDHIWESPSMEFIFLDKMKPDHGLLGRDLMRKWKEVSLAFRKGNWVISIDL